MPSSAQGANGASKSTASSPAENTTRMAARLVGFVVPRRPAGQHEERQPGHDGQEHDHQETRAEAEPHDQVELVEQDPGPGRPGRGEEAVRPAEPVEHEGR